MIQALALLARPAVLASIGAAAALAFAGLQTVRLSGLKADLAELHAQAERFRAQQIEANRLTERSWAAVVDGVRTDAQTQKRRIAADRDRARAAADRLRERADALAEFAGGPTCDPAAASGSQAASAPAAVLANVLGRVAGAAEQLAAAADESRSAGLACERIADQLRQGQQPN